MWRDVLPFHGVWPTKKSPIIWEPASFLFCCFSLSKGISFLAKGEVQKTLKFGRSGFSNATRFRSALYHTSTLYKCIGFYQILSYHTVTTATYRFTGFWFQDQYGRIFRTNAVEQGGETYVWYTSKRLCHFRERLHDRLKEALCTLDSDHWSFW